VWFRSGSNKGTPWEKPEDYAKWNPVELVKNWKTPELVIHGGLDFRIPETHAFAAFSALQGRACPRACPSPRREPLGAEAAELEGGTTRCFAWIDK